MTVAPEELLSASSAAAIPDKPRAARNAKPITDLFVTPFAENSSNMGHVNQYSESQKKRAEIAPGPFHRPHRISSFWPIGGMRRRRQAILYETVEKQAPEFGVSGA
jgi:hypothetical protein